MHELRIMFACRLDGISLMIKISRTLTMEVAKYETNVVTEIQKGKRSKVTDRK